MIPRFMRWAVHVQISNSSPPSSILRHLLEYTCNVHLKASASISRALLPCTTTFPLSLQTAQSALSSTPSPFRAPSYFGSPKLNNNNIWRKIPVGPWLFLSERSGFESRAFPPRLISQSWLGGSCLESCNITQYYFILVCPPLSRVWNLKYLGT